MEIIYKYAKEDTRAMEKTCITLRRTAVLLLALCLLCAPRAIKADDNTSFSPEIAGSLDLNSSEWLSTGLNRALLTELMFLELGIKDYIDINDYSITESMVCKTDIAIVIAICGTYNTLIVFYTPEFDFAQYSFLSESNFTAVALNLAQNTDNIYINEDDDLETALGIIDAAFN